MAVSMAFTGQVLGHDVLPKAPKGFALTTSSFRKNEQAQHVVMKRVHNDGREHITIKSRSFKDHRLHVIASTSNTNSSPFDTIEQFYECLNKKNLKKLGSFITNDCFFEDFSFLKPFKGKKEVLKFFEQLMTCTGENIEFNVVKFSEEGEGNHVTVAVNWHLEWKKYQIPFTRGCSLFELSTEWERLMIRKAQVMIESPMKPGTLALNLLKIVTSLFDAVPEVAECMLTDSPKGFFGVPMSYYLRSTV